MNSLYGSRGLIVGALVGNIMEFFDFIIYVYLSTYITKKFFPLEDQFVANILMFSVFASGYLTRPFGAMLFGYIGDKFGRKKALIQSIVLITVSTAGIGLLPVYSEIGVLSPLLLVLCRLTQGFAVSGEQSGAAVYLSETLSPYKKGFIGSLVLGSSYFGVLLGSLTCLVVSSYLSAEQMNDYGWRIPFLLSFILGSLSLFYRTRSEESAEFIKIKSENKLSSTPVKDTFKLYRYDMLLMILLVMGLAVPIYMYTVYIPNYISTVIGFEAQKSLIFSTLGLFFISIMVPAMGSWADKFGNERMLYTGLTLSFLFGYPIFLMLSSGIDWYIILGQICLGLTASLIAAPIFAVLLKMFPTHLRYTAISLVFNTSMAIFGSTVPIISMTLIKFFGNKAVPGIYLSLSGIIGMTALYFYFYKSQFSRSISHKPGLVES
jgi:MFS family permease